MGRRIDAAVYAAWWRRWERFEGSSLTAAEFCRREGVSQAAFYQWRKRLTQGATAGAQEPAAAAHGGEDAFVELAWAAVAVVEIELPNGVQVRVPADREQALTAAIRAAGEVVSAAGAREGSPC
jgi:transposase-like protein